MLHTDDQGGGVTHEEESEEGRHSRGILCELPKSPVLVETRCRFAWLLLIMYS